MKQFGLLNRTIAQGQVIAKHPCDLPISELSEHFRK
jgi:hypothetical protein